MIHIPEKSRSRVLGGRRAKQSGDSFEAVIELSARTSGVVCLEHLPSCGGRFVGKERMVNEAMPTDFIGSVIGSGRAIFFDAKSSAHPRGFDFRNEKLMKPHQVVFLKENERAGALAGVIVRAEWVGIYCWLDAGFIVGDIFLWESHFWVPLGNIGDPINFRALVG